MYNKKINHWQSNHYEKTVIAWSRESENRDNADALFVLADIMLEQARQGGETSEAVYLMEKAAKKGNSQAAFSMGQLFQYGWAVGRSPKSALYWYKIAAELGSADAIALAATLKRQKKLKRIGFLSAIVLLTGVITGMLIWAPDQEPRKGVIVHQDTELVQTITLDEFASALNNLVEQYDDEMVISGQRGSNRLMLQFEGEGIDLSDFPASIVLDNGSNFLVVQFDSAEEAQQCLNLLRHTKGVAFVEEDSYRTDVEKIMNANDLASNGVPYSSPYTGNTYFSWGVEYLGLDRLAAWIMTQQAVPVTVAVLDTGSEPCQEYRYLYLPGFDVVNPHNGNGWEDLDVHGTHVAGTIVDCTRGLNISILPVKVVDSRGAPESYIILGLQYAIQQGVDVINMSLGGRCVPTSPDSFCDCAKDYYIQNAINQGIVVVVSAGNGDDHGNPINTAEECPAHIGSCIVVAACDSSDRLASFSNYGESLDVCAPGVEVASYYPGGTLASLDGTSMAAPHISALAAMIKSILPSKTPAQIEKYIKDYCIDMEDPLLYGAGIPWAGYFAGN